jgi:hypothetical protein
MAMTPGNERVILVFSSFGDWLCTRCRMRYFLHVKRDHDGCPVCASPLLRWSELNVQTTDMRGCWKVVLND